MPISFSRRDFLQTALAFTAAAALPRTLQAAITPLAPTLPAPGFDHLALLSDVHVSGGLYVTMANHLSTAASQVLAQKPQKILVCGDCAYLSGADSDYHEYVRRIQPLADAGLPIHMTLGNHDDRSRFWNALPAERPEAKIAIHRQSMVVPGQQANWFMLDSLNQDDKDGGVLGRDQLEWLSAKLDALHDSPALIMVHHDLVRDGKPGSLKDADQLLAITRPRRHVKAIFFGHTHIWSATQDQSGIHLVNLPATGYTLWMKSFLGWIDCKVYPDRALLNIHALDPTIKENNQTLPLKWRA